MDRLAPAPVTEKPLELGFIGAGKMAQALIQGLIRSGESRPEGLRASDPAPGLRDWVRETIGVEVTHSNVEVSRDCQVLVLAVKPQAMAAVLAELRPHIRPEQLVISIAAGVSLAALGGGLGYSCRLARVMPNTPALVGSGASAYCLGSTATAEDARLVERLLGAVGRSVAVAEPLMDAVTGLSGSGPAFVYAVVEALSDGGVRMGLPREVATTLAAQTVLGAARMVLESGMHPGALKDQVTSPGGTTIAGLHAMERGGLRAALMDAVEAATLRSRELSNPGG